MNRFYGVSASDQQLSEFKKKRDKRLFVNGRKNRSFNIEARSYASQWAEFFNSMLTHKGQKKIWSFCAAE